MGSLDLRGNRSGRQFQDDQGPLLERTAVGKLKWVQKIGEQVDSSKRGRAGKKTLNRKDGAEMNK